ncbi:hypothetical protein F0L68_37435 [Solihabitans fulvus]|uniref:Uncharacterized protein n=1 Tax=Solihabitans fulvus TaxID=1892852 RepID=A0A5B2WHR7_9PSEU|nr:hypothetical protein [Solihabitans fulvus]KAA2251371.1 hypothetical protein F0L68_37435 [Solihabitans fulvus]
MDEFTFEFLGDRDARDGDARSLAHWLNSSGDLRGAAELRMAPPEPGEQGGAADAVLVLAAAVPLARPFFTWLTERAKQRRTRVRIVRSDQAGTTVEFDAANGADAQRLFGDIARFLDEDRDEELE